MNRRSILWRLVLAASLGAASTSVMENAYASRNTGPWNMAELKQPPTFAWGKQTGKCREVYYHGEPYRGKPTRVFAYYARPQGKGPFPAMVLVHGGGGQAFSQWAELWADRGYAAIAMDLKGNGPDRQPLADGGPDLDASDRFWNFGPDQAKEMWPYHGVAAVVRAHSLLASLPEVDAKRIGITGISWGGYLTCIVSGVDDRLKVSVPVYGCGFLHENSAWTDRLRKMAPDSGRRWIDRFDPSRYLPGVDCPILFVNGTNDKAYPLDSYQKSYELVPGGVTLCIRIGMRHGHAPGWQPIEIGLFVDSVLRGGVGLAHLEPMKTRGNRVEAAFQAKSPIVSGQLQYTSDRGRWAERRWESVPADIKDGVVRAELPAARPLVYFLSIIDERGALVSTPHATLEP